MDGRDSDTPESQRLRRELASQLRLFSTGGVPQAVNHNIQPYQLTPSSSNGFAPNQSSHTQPPRSTPTPYNSAAGIYQPSHPQQGQVFQPSSTRVLHGTSTGPSGSATPNAAYGSFSGSAPVISTQHGNHPLSSAGQLPPSTRSHQSPYQHQTQVSQGPGLAVQGFRFQPQVRPHPAFAPNNQPRTTYPPNAVPITGPTAGAPLQAGASFNFNNLLQTIASPTIQRPQFAAARHAPMPAGYPAPNIQPAPVPVPVPIPVDPTLRRIKYLTDTFHAAATNDPALYLLYCRFRDAQTQHVAFPELVFFLRLHLQVGWIEFLEQQGRQDEIGDTLIHERKDLILWLVNQYKTLKQRAGEYLTRKLAAFAPLDFEPKKVSPVAFLIDHLYVLENDLFYKPKKPAAPTKQQYRIRVATYLDYEGGEPKVVQDANIQKNSTWEQMQGTLSALTQNIQSAQLGYNYGWLAGGYYGNWLFWAGESEEPQGWNRLLMTEGDFREMKGLLAQGQKVYIEHSQQVEVKDNLELADALGLGLYRPFDFCKPLPPGYRSGIMGAYPNPTESSLLSGGNAGGGPAPQTRPRRGKPSVLAHQHQIWLRKQRQSQQKARAFEIRGKK
ncbi:hypothetical protein D6C92_01645 [Aureobasidium pullulans]|uniref:Uncharacterized protein n=1 Tax=Aureobasidium pullulans TaxID=5580 RepID=A0A4S9RTV1_AURPU|nr:hypothetical protein D6D28_05319 [Aureobasidium pullulans]THZ00693.1 hypothetical protein D6C92_01645 [Aureobasidium pullulans]